LDLAIFLSLKASIEVMDMLRFSSLLVSYSLDQAAAARYQYRAILLNKICSFSPDYIIVWICFGALA
jgi:hypothetical protein